METRPAFVSQQSPIVISTLAFYQTRFWSKVAIELQKSHFNVAFISFDQLSTDALRAENFTVHSLHEHPKPKNVDDQLLEDWLSNMSLGSFEELSRHERVNFNRTNVEMKQKAMWCIEFLNKVFSSYGEQKAPVVFQELGGFISVVTTFAFAKSFQFPHFFMEPAFFKGRLLFLKDSFSTDDRVSLFHDPDMEKFETYIAEALTKKTVVIPVKDAHHYQKVIQKVFNFTNFYKLLQKIKNNVILRKQMEFDAILSHVSRHLGMFINSLRLRKFYNNTVPADKFIYFPLHVPGDVALTIRAPDCLDQVRVITELIPQLPASYKLAIKEHPAMIGAVDMSPLQPELERREKLLLVAPHVNNYTVMEKADLVISINSKSGAEACLINSPVILLGEAFYKNFDGVMKLNRSSLNPTTLLNFINQAAKGSDRGILRSNTKSELMELWKTSIPGELYFEDPDNVAVVARSIISCAEHRDA